MKKLILSFSILFCLFFIHIVAKPISGDQNTTESTTNNNQIELLGNLPNQGSRSLIKPIILLYNCDILETSFLGKLGLITIEILDETNNTIYKFSIDTDTQDYHPIITSNFKNRDYSIVFTNSQGHYLKGNFKIER